MCIIIQEALNQLESYGKSTMSHSLINNFYNCITMMLQKLGIIYVFFVLIQFIHYLFLYGYGFLIKEK